MIYAIQNVETRNVKIGWSRDPRRRMSRLQVGCDRRLALVATWSGSKEDESAAHDHLKGLGLHVRGEWFKAEAIDRAFEFMERHPPLRRIPLGGPLGGADGYPQRWFRVGAEHAGLSMECLDRIHALWPEIATCDWCGQLVDGEEPCSCLSKPQTSLPTTKRPIVKCLDELSDNYRALVAAAECSYRRGYSQGFWAAIKALRTCRVPKATLERLEDFHSTLMRWRCSPHNGREDWPPTLSGKGP